MGWDINVFRIDFDRLRRIQGSNDERLLEQIASAYALDEEDSLAAGDEEDEDDEPRLPVKQALRNILFNTIADDQPDPSYSDAMGLLYSAIGAEHIGDLRVAALGITSFFHEVDAVLSARGLPEYFSQLVLGGSPLPVPVDAEGALGFMTPAECEHLSGEYSRHDWSAAQPPLQDTVKDLWHWCSQAAKHGQGLVAAGG
jgi:hypothetical protein